MVTPTAGEVVLVPFPFSNLLQSKGAARRSRGSYPQLCWYSSRPQIPDPDPM